MTRLTVWKYSLPVIYADSYAMPMPLGAEVLTVQLQRGVLTLWARVDAEQVITSIRRFVICGTGQPCSDGEYIGTILLHDGDLVLHVFEVKP